MDREPIDKIFWMIRYLSEERVFHCIFLFLHSFQKWDVWWTVSASLHDSSLGQIGQGEPGKPG